MPEVMGSLHIPHTGPTHGSSMPLDPSVVQQPVRRHGFQRPLDPLFIVAWVLFCIDVVVFVVFYVVPIPWFTVQLIIGVVGSVLMILYVALGVKAAITDPSDVHILKNKSAPKTKEELYFCQYCNCHVFQNSKHCRACNKCVHRFDHHCRWLNNCVGVKNYHVFFVYVVVAFVLSLFSTAIAVFMMVSLYFEWGSAVVQSISLVLGMDPTAYTVITALFIVLGLVVIGNTGSLLLFHIHLRLRGLTTFDYIMAKRKLARDAQIAATDALFKGEKKPRVTCGRVLRIGRRGQVYEMGKKGRSKTPPVSLSTQDVPATKDTGRGVGRGGTGDEVIPGRIES